MLKRKTVLITALALGAAIVVAGCGGGGSSGEGPLKVVATTTQVSDLVREVGGEDVELTQILQPNTDPHEYEPRPDDVEAVATADLVFRSGGHLDEWADQLVEDSGSGAEVVDVSSGLPVELHGGEHEEHAGEEGEEHAGEEHPEDAEGEEHAGEEHAGEEGEEVDPHWWHDPANAEAAVAEIETALIAADPDAEKAFTANATDYTERLKEMDRSIAQCFDSIPASERLMVTDHDAFGYLAGHYGIEVVGTVIPALTTQAEPSAGDLAELEETIREKNVKAIFPESSVPEKLSDAVAADTGASTEFELYGDTLGPEGSDGATYVEMMQANADNLMRGFTGGERGCDFS